MKLEASVLGRVPEIRALVCVNQSGLFIVLDNEHAHDGMDLRSDNVHRVVTRRFGIDRDADGSVHATAGDAYEVEEYSMPIMYGMGGMLVARLYHDAPSDSYFVRDIVLTLEAESGGE